MNNGKILVMDDEIEIRCILTKMLNRLHYEVVEAGDGEEAIELFKNAISLSRPFDVILMDLMVPGGMGGEEAISKLLEIDPEAKIILSSGSIESQIMTDYRKYGISAVLCKPFGHDELIRALQVVNESG